MIIKLENKKIELTDLLYEYLYPYLIRFSIKNNIDVHWEDNIIYISNENRNIFIEMLKNIFEELMNECYLEPTHKQRSKYSTRYRKIYFEDKLYILNYRTDIVGKVGYGLDYLIAEINKIESPSESPRLQS